MNQVSKWMGQRANVVTAAAVVIGLAFGYACTEVNIPTAPAPTVTVIQNQGSHNSGATTTPTPAGASADCTGNPRRPTALGWSVMGGLLPNGTPLQRFATHAPNGTVAQFDFTPKDSTGPVECHGLISYSTPSGPCTLQSGSPENFNPRVLITGTSGICQLRATVDGFSATAEIQAVP